MASVFSKSLQIYNAEQFKKSIESADDPYVYFTFGKVDPWPDDNSPPQANASVDVYNTVWKNMIGAKNIIGSDVRLGIRRFDWAANTVYNAYDDCTCSMNMNDANNKFYVVTDDWNIYKCIANNNGANSTTKPTSTLTTATVETADGYVWKYMYTLTDEERLRFVTDEYIPVKTLREDNGSLQWQVQSAASNTAGSIEAIKIINPGVNYPTSGSINITGDGADAQASFTANATTGVIEKITIIDPGYGYTTATASIVAVSGSQGEARVVISPPGGHGSDPVEELGGSFVIINARLKSSETNVLDVNNEFRQVALIKNPLLYNSKNLASSLVYSQTVKFIMDEDVIGDYEEDEIVFQGADVASSTYRGRVASWTAANNRLELIDTYGDVKGGQFLTGETSRVSKFNSLPQERGLKPYTGELLYVNYISPIQRDVDQTEDFKIVISF